MTKDEKVLVKIGKPVKYRTLKKFVNKVKEILSNLKESLHLFILNVEADFNLVKHEECTITNDTDWIKLPRSAGRIKTDNIQFAIQVNRCKRETNYINRYIKKGKILKDLSTREVVYTYSAFPARICLVVGGVPTAIEHRSPMFRLEKEEFIFDADNLRKLQVCRELNDWYTEEEFKYAEEGIFKDIYEAFKKYMDTSFKFMDYLIKVG